MQNRYQTHFADRALYYLAADLYSQAEKGDKWNYKLTPVYGIFLMNFKWQEVEEQHIREDVCLYNMHTHKVFSEKMEAIPHTFMQDPVFRNLGKVAKYAALSEHDKHAYKASLKAYRDAYAIAETERSEGRAEGKAEGRAEGKAEERKSNFKAMVSFGITTEQIAKKFGLSEDEVLKIIQ